MIESKPAIPEQPREAVYGMPRLYLFKEFTRESFKAQFGVEAPAYDPTRRPKAWFDTTVDASDPEELQQYLAIRKAGGAGGTWAQKKIGIPAGEARVVNLPDDQTIQVSRPWWEVPTRELAANEGLLQNPIGPPVVRRFDITPAGDAGQFTEHDRRVLYAVAEKIGLDLGKI